MAIDVGCFIDALPGLIWTARPDGRAEHVGKGWLEYTGLRFDDAIGVGWLAAVHPEDASRLMTAWAAIIASGGMGESEARLRRHDGVYRRFLFRVRPLADRAGNVSGWWGMNFDIDDWLQTEAPREHQRRFETMVDALPGLVWTTTPDGTSDFINQRWREYAGLTLEEVRGRRGWTSAIHPDDMAVAQKSWDSFVAASEAGGVEARLRRFDGEYRRFDIRTAPIADDGRIVGWCGINTDIEDRRLAEEALLAHQQAGADEALNRARAELAQVARAATLSALTASIAHEVNQPLAALVANASTCLRMLTADPPNLEVAQTTARRTIRDANRASEVIQRLRAMFARKQPASEAVDLNEAAREVLALAASELQNAHVLVQADFAVGLPSVRGDRVQLQQVILNLILNAADAMRAVEDRPRNLRIATARDASGRVRLSVRDAGIGIEPANLGRLFDAFYTTKKEGMGIGLSISRSIIQGHDGRLWAASNDDGPGATFAFSIPCDVAGSTEPGSKEA